MCSYFSDVMDVIDTCLVLTGDIGLVQTGTVIYRPVPVQRKCK